MSSNSLSVRRIACGVIAVAFIAFAIVTYFFSELPADLKYLTAFAARGGAIFAVLWLAWPQLSRFNLPMPTWFMALCAAGIIAAIRSAQTLIVVVPILALAYFLGRVWRGDIRRAELAAQQKAAKKSAADTQE